MPPLYYYVLVFWTWIMMRAVSLEARFLPIPPALLPNPSLPPYVLVFWTWMIVRAVSLEARLMTIRSAGSNFKSVVIAFLPV